MSTGQSLLKYCVYAPLDRDVLGARLPSLPVKQSQRYGPHGLQKQGNVLERRAVQNVLQIVPGLVFRRILIAQAMNLGQSGHSWFYAEPLLIPVAIVSRSLRSLRPGSDQTHLAAQNIEELR